ncbi:MAG TPA: carboxypeptidase-like regulatory domain-containing protein, partial [Puia sp.]
MRLTAAILLFAVLHVSASGYSQRITLSMYDQPLEKVLKAIEKLGNVEILYNNDLVRQVGPVTVVVKDAGVDEALTMALARTKFSFKIVEGILIISPREESAPAKPETAAPPGEITGKVTALDGSPLRGVSVVNKTRRYGTQTDAAGVFTIAAGEKDVIEFTFVGYGTQVYKVTGKNADISIVLTPQASNLNEVVMIGYGAFQRRDLTGSVSTISGKTVQDIPFNTVDNAIAGKAAGVQVTKTDGTPGGAVRIRVRGTASIIGGNDPLYVIDGVPMQVQSSYVNQGY